MLIQDTITVDPCIHGLVFILIIAGSDKTKVSVATGHQEYHPVYKSSGCLTNTAQQGHGLGVMPIAFLPIPKGQWLQCIERVLLTSLLSLTETLQQAQIPQVLLAALSYLPCKSISAIQSGNEDSWAHLMLWWSLVPHNIWALALHCRLPWAGLPCWDCPKLVSKVSCDTLLLPPVS